MFSEIHAASLIASFKTGHHNMNMMMSIFPGPPARELNHDVIFQKGGSDAVSCTGISPDRVQTLMMVLVKERRLMLKVQMDEMCSGISNGITGRTDWERMAVMKNHR